MTKVDMFDVKQKAMYIAEKQSWVFEENTCIYKKRIDVDRTERISEKQMQELYCTFNGLMPIVVKINMDTLYTIYIECTTVRLTKGGNNLCYYNYDNEHELIDALQSSIIKYYEESNV